MKRFKFPTASDLEVMRTNNIMTDLMLPVASSLADRVFVVGADGRADDDTDFWEHNEEVKYDSEMRQAVVDANPSQFRDIVYPNYYRAHVNVLDNLVHYGECRGVEYRALTESHVPCLSEREAANAR